MSSPIRIQGVGGGSSSSTGLVLNYESPDGDVWGMVSPDDRTAPVVIPEDGIQGLVGRIEWTTTESVNQYGVRHDGFRTAPLDITLDYVLRSHAGDMETLSRMWERAWSFAEPGKLRLFSAAGGMFWTPVHEPVFPDWPFAFRRQRLVQGQMSCRGLLGHWFGETERFTGAGTFRVNPGGDRPLAPSLKLIWDGSETSFRFPSGLQVNLPAIGAERHINLDRGMSGQMTRPDGTVDSGGWSSLQGIVSGVTLRPGEDSVWVLGAGITLEVTPRYLSPWR